jgi:hypothetical protein
LGAGFEGALTKAVDWVRNAVFAVLIAEIRELTAPPEANGRKGVKPFGPGTPSAPVPLQSAIAAVDVRTAAKAAPANVQPAARGSAKRPTKTGAFMISVPRQESAYGNIRKS